jgi:hypothetical protein
MSDGGKGDKQRPTNKAAFNTNYDAIFRKPAPIDIENALNEDEEFNRIEKMQVRVKANAAEFGSCGCGRSPTGKCIGWHGLTELDFQAKLEQYHAEQQVKHSDQGG